MSQKIIVIADPHLGMRDGDFEGMKTFIETLNPKEDQILFLGDLFHIWAGVPKYWEPETKRMLDVFAEYRKKGGKIDLIVGNRDIFLPEKTATDSPDNYSLPFDIISHHYYQIGFAGKKIVANHGDLVNRKDLQYLRWRKIIKSKWFRFGIGCLPSSQVKKIMFKTEEKFKQTNQGFRLDFPMKEWTQFVTYVYEQFQPDLLLIGHFHPKNMIETTYQTTHGIVAPDWLNDRSYLEIDELLNINHKNFK